jgi:hypothetical protein
MPFMARKPKQPGRRGRPPLDPNALPGERSPAIILYARLDTRRGQMFRRALALSGRTMKAELQFALDHWFRHLGLDQPPATPSEGGS